MGRLVFGLRWFDEPTGSCHSIGIGSVRRRHGPGKALFQEACRHGLEGVVAERLKTSCLPDSCTTQGSRSSTAKNVNCMIMGIVPSGKDDFGSLIIAAEA
jgi:hypothetical protein